MQFRRNEPWLPCVLRQTPCAPSTPHVHIRLSADHVPISVSSQLRERDALPVVQQLSVGATPGRLAFLANAGHVIDRLADGAQDAAVFGRRWENWLDSVLLSESLGLAEAGGFC
jgi:hypothetical protein